MRSSVGVGLCFQLHESLRFNKKIVNQGVLFVHSHHGDIILKLKLIAAAGVLACGRVRNFV